MAVRDSSCAIPSGWKASATRAADQAAMQPAGSGRTVRTSSAMTMKKSAEKTDAPSARPAAPGSRPFPPGTPTSERQPSEDERERGRRGPARRSAPGHPRRERHPYRRDEDEQHHRGRGRTGERLELAEAGGREGGARRGAGGQLAWPDARAPSAGAEGAQHEGGHQQPQSEQGGRTRAELVRPPGEHGHGPERHRRSEHCGRAWHRANTSSGFGEHILQSTGSWDET